MPQIDLPVDFYKLQKLSKEHQAVVADYLMMRKEVGAFEADFIYYFNQMPNTYAIRFKQDVELVASVKHLGRFHCFIADKFLGEGTFAMVRKSALKVTLLPDQNNHGHFQFAEPKSQSRAIKYANLGSYSDRHKEASDAVVAEVRCLSMVAPARLHHRIPVGRNHSDTFVPRIIMPCYPGENLLALSELRLHSKDFCLQTKCELSIRLLAKLMFLQQWFIHRDLKPANIVVDIINLDTHFVDFASAVIIDKFVNDDRGTRGSPGYVAPERFTEQSCQFPKAIDTFSVGVVIAELFVSDTGLWQSVASRFLAMVCEDLYENWDTDHDRYKKSPCKKAFEHKPDDITFLLIFVRKSLLTRFGTDLFLWNNTSADFASRLGTVVGTELVLQTYIRLENKVVEGYSIPSQDLDVEENNALRAIIMSLVATEPSARATPSEALKKFIQFYQKKFPDDHKNLKHRIQKQLLMAAVDVAIQRLKAEVYKISFDEIPNEEKPKIACLREILEKLIQFRKQHRSAETTEVPKQASASSSSEVPASVASIDELRTKVIECFPADKNVIAKLSSHRSLHGKVINEASKLIGCFFKPPTNPLAAAQAGLYLPQRFQVAAQALQIIENAIVMADDIFRDVSAAELQILVDFTKLQNLSKANQEIVANFIMLNKNEGAFEANKVYDYFHSENDYTIIFQQKFELVASDKVPDQYHCYILDTILGKGSYASVYKSTLKITLSPVPGNSRHFQFSGTKFQSRAIKYANLESYDGDHIEASKAATEEVKHMAMVAPARLHPRNPKGNAHSDSSPPRIIMNCYPGENLLALSKRKNLAKEYYSLKTKCALSISLLAKLMILQEYLMHLDLKPLNMMVDMPNCEINFIDFAFAETIRASVVVNRGSPLYSAPEVVTGQECKYPKAIDIFSVGVVIAMLFVTDESLEGDVVSPIVNNLCHKTNSNQSTSILDFYSLRNRLVTSSDGDVYLWSEFRMQPQDGNDNVKINCNLSQYTIPYKDLESNERIELTTIIMGLVKNDPAMRATASDALKQFIQFYRKKFPDDFTTLKHRIQKQLLMAAVDVAIQKLKGEVYKKPSSDASVAGLRRTLENLKDFRKEQRKLSSVQPSAQGSACSSSDSPVSVKSIEALRQEVTAFFPVDCNGVSAHHGFNDKATQKATSSTNGFFSQSSKPLEIGAQALKLIKDANRMADEIFANIPALRSQFSH